MAVISEQVATILEDIQGLDFDLGNIKFRNHHFHSIGAAIRDCRIGVLATELSDGTYAAYSSAENVIYYRSEASDLLWDPWVKSSFVHEAAHVIHDSLQRSWMTRNENEGSCYVAQMVYCLNNLGSIPGGYKKLTAMRNVLDAAVEVAYEITGKPTFVDYSMTYSGALPEQDAGEFLKIGGVWPPNAGDKASWKKVVDLLGAKGAYPENIGVKCSDCAGIPIRGNIKRIETKSNTLSLSIGKRTLDYTWDAATSFEKPNGVTLPLGPKDPKLVPGQVAIVVCEKIGAPNYATIIRAMNA